jgi:hypothetical protein
MPWGNTFQPEDCTADAECAEKPREDGEAAVR